MKPPIRWFGGKGLIAEKIVNLFPAHRLYLEPFAGSLAVLYAKDISPIEIVNDQHGELVNMYRQMRRKPKQFQRAVKMIPFSREDYRAGFRPDPELDPVERAALFFSYTWMNHGSAAGRSTISGFTSHSPLSYSEKIHQWGDAKGRLPVQCARLESVIIEKYDAHKLIAKYEKYGKDSLIYCDPPYVRGPSAERRDAHKYQHEFGLDDHSKLSAILNACTCHVAISYYDEPSLREFYLSNDSGGKWHWNSIEGARRNLSNEPNGSAPEILITNYDPITATPLFG